MKVLISLLVTLILTFLLGVSIGASISFKVGCITGIFETFKFQYDLSKTPNENYGALRNKCEHD